MRALASAGVGRRRSLCRIPRATSTSAHLEPLEHRSFTRLLQSRTCAPTNLLSAAGCPESFPLGVRGGWYWDYKSEEAVAQTSADPAIGRSIPQICASEMRPTRASQSLTPKARSSESFGVRFESAITTPVSPLTNCTRSQSCASCALLRQKSSEIPRGSKGGRGWCVKK